mgnify:CR=1 FL=1
MIQITVLKGPIQFGTGGDLTIQRLYKICIRYTAAVLQELNGSTCKSGIYYTDIKA